VLGDKLFHGHDLEARWKERPPCADRAAARRPVFAYRVADPERYGVVEFDARGRR
jgi:glucose-1-phosphate thymidylyltransferase